MPEIKLRVGPPGGLYRDLKFESNGVGSETRRKVGEPSDGKLSRWVRRGLIRHMPRPRACGGTWFGVLPYSF